MSEQDKTMERVKKYTRRMFVAELRKKWCPRCDRIISGCIYCHKAKCRDRALAQD